MNTIKLMVLFILTTILGIALTNCSKDDDAINNPEEKTQVKQRTQVELTTDFLSRDLWEVESVTSPNGKLSQDEISNLLKIYENVRFRFDGNMLYILSRDATKTLEKYTFSIEGNAISTDIEESNIIDYNGLRYSRFINVKALRNNGGNGDKFLEFKIEVEDESFDKFFDEFSKRFNLDNALEEILEREGINPTPEAKAKLKAELKAKTKAGMKDAVYVWKTVSP